MRSGGAFRQPRAAGAISGTRSPERAGESSADGDLELTADVSQEIDRILAGSRTLTGKEA
jgi:hypothetical protein